MDKTPIGFMSYARSDDAHENGKLSEFRQRLRGEVRMQSGDDSFDIFQDQIDIVWGQQWQQRLDDSLDSVKLLIPIITPKFFKSEACRAEVARFMLREKQLGRNDLILPVYYVSAPVLEDKAKLAQDDIAQVIASHQRMDWRELRHESLTSVGACRTLEKMARQIVAAMERASAMVRPESVLESKVEIIRSLPESPVQPARSVDLTTVEPSTNNPAWASAAGTDANGAWAEIKINNVVQRLRWVAPGNFLMGSPLSEVGRIANEGPQQRVTISQGLWIADTACTQDFWQAVMGKNPSHFHGENRGGSQYPVENVSWNDIQPFLQTMTQKLGCKVTLPTEAEWEYACRAGSQTTFSFGETINGDQINFDGDHPVGSGVFRRRTVPVNGLPANEWGLYQMHGNVWEWCDDHLRTYDGKAVVDPRGSDAVPPSNGAAGKRVIRGGGWRVRVRSARSAYRGNFGVDSRDRDLGFRFVVRPGAQTNGI